MVYAVVNAIIVMHNTEASWNRADCWGWPVIGESRSAYADHADDEHDANHVDYASGYYFTFGGIGFDSLHLAFSTVGHYDIFYVFIVTQK